MHILVTGGAGLLGRALVPTLQRLGHTVSAPRRGFEGFPLDLADVAGWENWPDGVEAVVHLAALNPERGSAVARDDAALMRANVAGTKALAERAAREGVRRFALASTLLVHPYEASPVNERSPTAPQNTYAASKLAAEDALRLASDGTDVVPTILRLAPIYGPEGRGGIAALLRLAQSPWPLPLGGGGRRSFLSVRNAAGAFAHVLERTGSQSETFLVADREAVSIGELLAEARQIGGRPARVVAPPPALMRRIAALGGRGDTYRRLFAPFEADTAKLRGTGWTPPETLREGLQSLIEAGASS